MKALKIPFQKKHRPYAWGALAVFWIAALALVAFPSFRQAVAYHKEVQDLEKGLADLDSWTVAGKWLERSLAEDTRHIEQTWQQTFPMGRAREDLFLNLAQVADRSGVREFRLEEIQTEGTAAFLVSPPQSSFFGGSVYGVPVEVPQVTLGNYRVKASFLGNYEQAANFLGGLQSIPRAVSVHHLVARPGSGGITIDLELDIYVSQQS
jgi:hypothetical protein|nr:hypothetical protein [Candidatus Krumholzibacteria bacterium]